jgi:hypothetical protein
MMANQVAARIGGDDYQHLFAWAQVLELLMPNRQVTEVIVEDEHAGSADDVTVLHEAGSERPDRYHQIKYHVDHRSSYTEDVLTETKGNGRSLIQKWYRSWLKLTTFRPGRPVELHILSNWSPGDDLGPLLSGRGNMFKEEFFDAPSTEDAGKLRARLAAHLSVTEANLCEFARVLRIRLGYGCEHDMAQRAADRMEWLGLKSDETALQVAAGIVREWVKAGRQSVTKDVLEFAISHHGLRLPSDARPAVNVYLTTIKHQLYEIEPDFALDWRHYFLGRPNKRGHELAEPTDWNGKMLPEMEALEARINRDSSRRFVRVRGQARLSAWFAFGYTFSEVNRYTLEVDQQGRLWPTDAPLSANFTVIGNGPDGDPVDVDGTALAVGVSVTGPLEDDVRAHLQHEKRGVRAVLFLRPDRDLGNDTLQSAGDAVALASGVKDQVRAFVKRYGATRLFLYYFGPLSGACFIGHRLNAVCSEVVIMERSDPNYVPSFVLT